MDSREGPFCRSTREVRVGVDLVEAVGVEVLGLDLVRVVVFDFCRVELKAEDGSGRVAAAAAADGAAGGRVVVPRFVLFWA